MKNPNAERGARKTPPREGAENTDGFPRDGGFSLERGFGHVPGQRWSGGYGGDAAQPGPHFGKGPKGYNTADARIHTELCEAIANQGEIDATKVELKVENGIVTLRGMVVDEHAKSALEQLVSSRLDQTKLRSELRVAG